jgi:hypothetical protein
MQKETTSTGRRGVLESDGVSHEQEATGGLGGFLFGNVDAEGRLEADYLDPEAKASLHLIAPIVLDEDDLIRAAAEQAVGATEAPDRVADSTVEAAPARAATRRENGVSPGAAALQRPSQTGFREDTQRTPTSPLQSPSPSESIDFYDASDLSDDAVLSDQELDASVQKTRGSLPEVGTRSRKVTLEPQTEGAAQDARRHGLVDTALKGILLEDYDEQENHDPKRSADAETRSRQPQSLGEPDSFSALQLAPEQTMLEQRRPLKPCVEDGVLRFTRFLVPEEKSQPFYLGKRKRIQWQSKTASVEDRQETLGGEELLFQRPDDLGWITFPYAYLILEDRHDVEELVKKRLHRSMVAGQHVGGMRMRPPQTDSNWQGAQIGGSSRLPPTFPTAPEHHDRFGTKQGSLLPSTTPLDLSRMSHATVPFLWQQWAWEADVLWDGSQPRPPTAMRYLTDRERLQHDFYRNDALVDGFWTQAIVWERPTQPMERRPGCVSGASAAPLALDTHARELCGRLSWLCIDENDPQLILCRAENRLVTQPAPNRYLPLQVGHIEALMMNASNDRFYGTEMTEQRRRSARSEALANLRHALKTRQGYTSAWCYGYTEPQTYYRPNVLPLLWQTCGQKAVPLQLFTGFGMTTMLPHETRAWVPKSCHDLSAVSGKVPGQIYLLEYPLEADPFLVQLPGMASRLLSYSRRAAEGTQLAPVDDYEVVFLAADDLPPLHCGDVRPGQVVRVFENNAFAAPFERFAAPSTDFLVVCSAQRVLHVRPIDHMVAVGRLEPRNKPKVMIPNSDRMKRFVKNKIELDVTRELIRRGHAGVERAEIIQMFPRRRVYPETTIAGVLRETCDNARNRYLIKENYLEAVWPKREAELLRLVTPEETCAFESMEVGWEQLSAKGITIFSSPSMQGNIIGGAEKAGLGRRGIEIARYIREELAKTRWVRTELLVRAQKSLQFELRSVFSAATLAMDILRGDPSADDRLKTMSRDDALRFLKVQFSCNLNPSHRAAIEAPETRAATVRQIALERARQRPLVPLAVQVQRLIDQHVQTVQALPLEKQLLLLREGYPKNVSGRGGVAAAPLGATKASYPGNRWRTTAAAEHRANDIEERREFSRLLASHRVPNALRQDARPDASSSSTGLPLEDTQFVLKRRLKIIRKVDGHEQIRYIEDPQEIEAYKQHRRLREDALRTGIGGGIGFAAKSMTQSRKAGKKGTAEERLRERLEELAEAARRINNWTLGASAYGGPRPTLAIAGTVDAAPSTTTQAVHQIREAMHARESDDQALRSWTSRAPYPTAAMDRVGSLTSLDPALLSETRVASPMEAAALRVSFPSGGRPGQNFAHGHPGAMTSPEDSTLGGGGLVSAVAGEHTTMPVLPGLDLSGGFTQESSHSVSTMSQLPGAGVTVAPNRLKLLIPSGLEATVRTTDATGAQDSNSMGMNETSSGGLPRILIRPPAEEPAASISASTRASSGLEPQPSSSKSSSLAYDYGLSPKPGSRARVSKRSSGKVHLNNILREVELHVRDAEGVVVSSTPFISVARVRPGEPLPPGALDQPAKLAVAGNIDFINPVRDTAYRKQIPLPRQIYLQKIRRKCEEVAYGSVEEFLSDMKQLAENARQYHTAPEAHWVVQHAEYLYEAAQEEIAKRQKDIDEAIQKDAGSS